MARVFVYGDERWEDPGEEFSNEDVRRHLTTYFPELAQASIEEKTLDDGTVEVHLVKRAGTKGLTPGDVVGRLAGLEPVEYEAVALFRRLQSGESPVDLYPEIETARRELDEAINESRRTIDRCRRLQSCPSRRTPGGF